MQQRRPKEEGSLFSQFVDSTKAKNYQHFPYICEKYLKEKRAQIREMRKQNKEESKLLDQDAKPSKK
jgi:hypothetical protein